MAPSSGRNVEGVQAINFSHHTHMTITLSSPPKPFAKYFVFVLILEREIHSETLNQSGSRGKKKQTDHNNFFERPNINLIRSFGSTQFAVCSDACTSSPTQVWKRNTLSPFPLSPYLFLRSVWWGVIFLGGEGLKKEPSTVPWCQGIPLWDRSQLLEDGLWLAQQRTSPHLTETNETAELKWV